MYMCLTGIPKELPPTLQEEYEAFGENNKYSSPELIKDNILKQIPAIFQRAVAEGNTEIERDCALVLKLVNRGKKS